MYATIVLATANITLVVLFMFRYQALKTYFHLAHLKEGIDLGIIKRFVWTDTRDMLADGLTKGSIDRAVLHLAMQGLWMIRNPVNS